MEDVCGEILSFRAITNPPRHVSVDAVKVLFVQLGKAARVLLSSFYKEPFFGLSYLTQSLANPRSTRFSIDKTVQRGKGYAKDRRF